MEDVEQLVEYDDSYFHACGGDKEIDDPDRFSESEETEPPSLETPEEEA